MVSVGVSWARRGCSVCASPGSSLARRTNTCPPRHQLEAGAGRCMGSTWWHVVRGAWRTYNDAFPAALLAAGAVELQRAPLHDLRGVQGTEAPRHRGTEARAGEWLRPPQ